MNEILHGAPAEVRGELEDATRRGWLIRPAHQTDTIVVAERDVRLFHPITAAGFKALAAHILSAERDRAQFKHQGQQAHDPRPSVAAHQEKS